MSRPTKLTAETQARFLQGLKLGLTIELAANYAGVGKSTVYRWMSRAEQEEGPYREFRDAVKEAEGICAAQCMARILKAAEGGSWQASAWVMERRYSYSARQEIKVESVEDGLDGADELIEKVASIAEQLRNHDDHDDQADG